MSQGLTCFWLVYGVAALVVGCDPNVLIGAKWGAAEEGAFAGQSGSAGAVSGGAGGSMVVAGASGGSEAGHPGEEAGAGGAGALGEWCAIAPWINEPVKFDAGDGRDNIVPAGNYVITYVSGAQIHDPKVGYEVTDWYYGKNGLNAGHHVFSGANPETGATSLWLDEVGIVGSGGTIAQVEAANRDHTWPLHHAADGELFITLYDDLYDDNQGPGVRFCISAAP